ETNRDFFWRILAHGFNGFWSTRQSFWAFLFLSHGIVKIFVLSGLLKQKMWSYPIAAAVFVGFIIYQIYQMSITPSFFLIVITILDVLLVVLILHEYRHKKSRTVSVLN